MKKYPFICLGRETATFQFYNQLFLSQELELIPDTEAATTDQILPLVKNNLGLAFLPEPMALESLAKQEVLQIAISEKLPLRHICLVHDQQAAWLGQDGYPVQGSIQRDELGQYSNLEGYGMRSLRLNGEILYRNPYADRDLRLTDEEIAVAQMMEGMKTYVETGKEVYPLEEALQDTYLFLMMDEAAKEGKEIQTQDQCWKKQ